MTNTEKQSMLDELEKALFSGTLKIKYQDKEQEFRSVNEMTRLRETLKRELGIQKKKRRVNASHSKGL